MPVAMAGRKAALRVNRQQATATTAARDRSAAGATRTRPLDALQRTAGNQVTSRLLRSGAIQTKRTPATGSAETGVLKDTRCRDAQGAGHPEGVNLVPFEIEQDHLTPAHLAQLARFKSDWDSGGRRGGVDVHGYASTDGPADANLQLSCNRAEAVRHNLVARGVTASITTFAHGETREFGSSLSTNRRAIITTTVRPEPDPKPKPGPEPGTDPTTPTADVPDDARPNCTADAGLPPTDCALYRANEFWLPGAYVHNATCACLKIPSSTTANCIRKFLQERVKSTPQAVKDLWAVEKALEFINKAEYDRDLLELGLINRIFLDHVDAYDHCCCSGRPAPFASWVGVATVPLGCDAVRIAINLFGSCHDTPGTW